MKPDLHIVNGGSLAGSLRETGKVVNIAHWREALYTGPLELTDDVAFCALREKYWGHPTNWVLALEDVTHTLPNLTALLPQLQDYGQVILWFEFDLYDQSMLWYILRQFHQYPETLPPLFIISPDSFPGIPDFRGMGQLQPEQLQQLLGTEKLLTPSHLVAAEQTWEIYVSGDPLRIQGFLNQPTPFPYAKRALEIHLAQFPQPPFDLGGIQIALLHIIEELGSSLVYPVIAKIMTSYSRDYGLSDTAALEWLVKTSEDPRKLLEFLRDENVVEWEPEKVRETSVRLTPAGKHLITS